MTNNFKAGSQKQKVAGKKGADTDKSALSPIRDIWMPVIGVLLGFCFGIAQDIIKREYEYRMSTPRVRFTETASSPVQVDGKWVEEVTTRIQSMGHAQAPSIVVKAETNNSDISLTGMIPVKGPSFSPADAFGVPRNDQPQTAIPNIYLVRITNLHDPQFVSWTVKAKSSKQLTGNPVQFIYSGTNDIQDSQHLRLAERISTLPLAIILLIYSVTITIGAFLLYLTRKNALK